MSIICAITETGELELISERQMNQIKQYVSGLGEGMRLLLFIKKIIQNYPEGGNRTGLDLT